MDICSGPCINTQNGTTFLACVHIRAWLSVPGTQAPPQIVGGHSFNQRMEKKVDAGEEKHEQPGQVDDGVLPDRVEGDGEDEALHHGHGEGGAVAEGRHHVALVPLLAHHAVAPDLVHSRPGLDASLLHKDADVGRKLSQDAHVCEKCAAVGKE